MNRTVYSLGILLMLWGCATAPELRPSQAHYAEYLNAQWRGKKITDLIKSWGPIDSTDVTLDGHKTYTWTRMPTWNCATTAEADASGHIFDWQFSGSGCVMSYAPEDAERAKEKSMQLRSFCRTLKEGTYVRVTFFENAQDVQHHSVPTSVQAHFGGYNRFMDEITLTQVEKGGFILADRYTYEFHYVEDLTVLKNSEQPQPAAQ